MKKYKQGTKFTVCGHKELCNKGWILDSWGNYRHTDFPRCSLSSNMIDSHEGQTLTVDVEDVTNWYLTKEIPKTINYWIWPVATFLKDEEITGWRGICEGDTCIEGMTPLDGWFICKKCGFNLREIK